MTPSRSRWVALGAAAAAIAVGVAIARAAVPGSGPGVTAQQPYQAQLAQAHAADRAASPAPKSPQTPPSFAPCSPEALPTAGIDDSSTQVGPGSWETFVTTNQWTGPVAGGGSSAYVLWAGVTGESAPAPGLPAVAVDIRTLSSDGCTVTTRPVGIFTEHRTSGTLAVISVQGDWVSLRSPDGAPLYFDLATDRFTATATP